MSILSGKTKCVRCGFDIANEDMAGNTCIECLNELERIEQQHMDDFCSACLGYAVKKAKDYRGCLDVKCDNWKTELKLLRQEK